MSPIIDDLRIEAEIPPRPQRPGTAVAITLRLYNLGTRVRTIYFIVNEAFRFGQSTFRMHVSPQQTVLQPPRRDGYVPSAGDFHELPARSRLDFKQTLRLPADIEPGKHAVEWTYENRVDRWPSAPNIPSAGQPIPGIWEGSLVDAFAIMVSRPRTGRAG